MGDQLILDFPKNKVYLKEDFYVSSSNYEAYKLIDSWPKWIKRIVNIFGPDGSGKTHLSKILKSKTSVLEVKGSEISEKTFIEYKTKEALVIEDASNKISEKVLFNLWNLALQDNKYLLITSKKPISVYKFKLPDLTSRVKSCIIIEIKKPNDDLMSVILVKNFSDRQIGIEKKHVDYIIKRIDRSYQKISKFIYLLDQYSLKKGTPFSLKLIKEVLKMI